MDIDYLACYLLVIFPGYTWSEVKLQGDAFVKRGHSINLNCSSDTAPLGLSAEILVNSATYTNIRVFNGQCFSGILKGPCSLDICNCSEHGTWFSYRYTAKEDVDILLITCIMKSGLTDSMSDSISVRVIDMIGPVITSDTSFPLVAGTTVRFLCTVQTLILNITITWDCLASQFISNVVNNKHRYESTVEYKVAFSDHGKICTCFTNVENFRTSAYVQLSIEKAPILDLETTLECNSSYSVETTCQISGEVFVYGFYSWIHSFRGVFIRKINGIVNGSASILQLPTCEYQDAGEYTCMAWNNYSGNIYNASRSTTITVYSAPVVIRTETRRGSRLLLTAYIFSQSNISTPVWFIGKHMIDNSSKYVQKVEETGIEVPFYHTNVTCDGYIAILTMEGFESGQYVLLLQNIYGASNQHITVNLDTKTSFDLQIVIWIITAFVIFILTLTITVSLMRRCKISFAAGSLQDSMSSPRIYLSAAEQQNVEHVYDRTTPQYLELSSYEPRRQYTLLDREMNKSSAENNSSVYEEID